MIEPRLDNGPCGGKYADILEAIGHTPLVELRRLSPKPGVRIYAKLESYNPTGSVKDRVALAMIDDAEARGAIRPGQTILEPTSGNTGISLAMICSRRGYPLKVVMPDNVTEERTQLLRMFGAEIVYSPGAQGSNGAVAMALEAEIEVDRRELAEDVAEQPLIPRRELSQAVVRDAEGPRFFRREMFDADYRNLGPPEPLQGELVQGLRSLDDGYIPPILDLSLLDRKIFVSNRDAVVWTKRLLAEEGLFTGVSAGAIAAIAVRVASDLDEGNVVFVVPDDGWKYLSSGVYTKTLEELEDSLESASFW